MTSKDYRDGWHDCRTYAGEDLTRSDEYRAGFAACCRAYYESVKNGTGWDCVSIYASED